MIALVPRHGTKNPIFGVLAHGLFSFFLSTCFTIAWSTPMITILATVTGKMKNNNTKQKRKYQSRTADLQLYSTKF